MLLIRHLRALARNGSSVHCRSWNGSGDALGERIARSFRVARGELLQLSQHDATAELGTAPGYSDVGVVCAKVNDGGIDRVGEASVDIAAWLRGLGLEQYAPAFRDNDIDGEVLRRLTGEDLRELGVTSIGHRRRILDAIAALGGLLPNASETATSRGPPESTEAERRQLTVMFCDLVGSTPLSSRLDPEDLREVIAAYHGAVTEVVTRFEGCVSRYMGDGVLVYFGYPRAHEDDAERAVRAGLGAIDASISNRSSSKHALGSPVDLWSLVI
jgi:hypothetical protein